MKFNKYIRTMSDNKNVQIKDIAMIDANSVNRLNNKTVKNRIKKL